jgi:hypothetical protein
MKERASEHYVRVCSSAELLATSVRAHVLNHVSQRAFVLNGAFFRLFTTFGLHYTMHIPCAHIHHASTPQSLLLIPSSLPRYHHLSLSRALSLSPTLISTPTKTNKEFPKTQAVTTRIHQQPHTQPNSTQPDNSWNATPIARTLPSLHPQWHPGTYKYFVVLTAGRTPFSLQEIGGQDRPPLLLLCQPRQAQKPRLVCQMQANTSKTQCQDPGSRWTPRENFSRLNQRSQCRDKQQPNQANLHTPASLLPPQQEAKGQRSKQKVKARKRERKRKGRRRRRRRRRRRNVYIQDRRGRERNWVSSRGGSGALWEERFRRSSHRTPFIGALQASWFT